MVLLIYYFDREEEWQGYSLSYLTPSSWIRRPVYRFCVLENVFLALDSGIPGWVWSFY